MGAIGTIPNCRFSISDFRLSQPTLRRFKDLFGRKSSLRRNRFAPTSILATFARIGSDPERCDLLPNDFVPEIIVVPDRAALARNAATRFVALAQEAITAHGQFSVALSGGSTPRDLYALLATPEFSAQIDWSRVHFFWGDERAVPPDHPDSNYRMANETLLSCVKMPARNVHRILAELAPDSAARAYEETLREFFYPRPAPSPVRSRSERGRDGEGVPCFDLILLGLGANGHTASLFPHTQVLHATTRWVAAQYIDEVKMNRITLTAPVINAAKNILFLVAGEDKAAAVRAVLRGAYRPDVLPAQLIQPANAHAVWLLDEDAASQLEARRSR
ncbi:MAG: 6-phosphogluconolactonase [Chloroflexota bacterium]|nr:6-phosphogluconolactonase [Chloroflexota bacterium]